MPAGNGQTFPYLASLLGVAPAVGVQPQAHIAGDLHSCLKAMMTSGTIHCNPTMYSDLEWAPLLSWMTCINMCTVGLVPVHMQNLPAALEHQLCSCLQEMCSPLWSRST